MSTIYAYTKAQDQYTTYQLITPEDAIELCTIDGTTYVSIPDGEPLPDGQPDEIVESIEVPVLTAELVAAIKASSPYCRRIADRRIEMIREKYSADDEFFFARIAGGQALDMYTITPDEQAELVAYKNYVEDIRIWGRQQYAAIGLVAAE